MAAVIRPTGIDRSDSLTRLVGRPVLLKQEHLQRTGSFKIRGAYNHIVRLAPEVRERGVVAASAGNHAQGVALAADLLGVRATIFMPETAPLPKVDATRGYGAEVRLVGSVVDDTLDAARSFADERGASFVAPFDDIDVIAGQGTLGLELVEQATGAETFVVPVGGGGLVAGLAAALKARRPGVRVVGVEAAGAAAMTEALVARRPVRLSRLDTMADGIAVGTVSDLTLDHTRAFVDDVATVSEEQISTALLLLMERAKAVVEPAGAVGLAAVLADKVGGPPGAPVCVVLSGGNIDPLLLMRVIQHGLVASGRYLVLRLVLEDRPGRLSELLGRLAAEGLNVIGVDHHREGPHLSLHEVEIRLTLETRDPEHRDEVVESLREAGYRVESAGLG